MRVYAAATETVSKSTPKIQSETAVLMDASTGQILYQKNMRTKMYPASITKIMTGMLALKNAELTDVITMSYDGVFSIDRDSSHVALDVDEQITLEQALYALSIESANDAANGIAELVGGSMESFVVMMNAAAKEIGAENTQFANAHGLFDENHYTTAYDMAKITAEAIKVPGFTDVFSATYFEIPPTNKQPDTRYFGNRNKLLNGEMPYEGIIMSKTGWTSESQHTLVTAAKRGGTTLIAVVMKSSMSNYKWDDTVQLLDYGFSQFYRTEISISQLASQLSLDAKSEISEPRTFSLLLPSGTSPGDLDVHLDGSTSQAGESAITVPLCLQIDDLIYSEDDLFETQVTISPVAALKEGIIESEKVSAVLPEAAKKRAFPMILIVPLIVFAVATIMYILHLRANLLRRKRRIRKRNRHTQAYRNADQWKW
ncbi:MAG: D-alanyl-D-alanine carboxypeptidase [Oscillospiraceae bacterium]|nr:D-alanyl-D-alanine carboxypeptidase [Oscillospiraceae bacterium]